MGNNFSLFPIDILGSIKSLKVKIIMKLILFLRRIYFITFQTDYNF